MAAKQFQVTFDKFYQGNAPLAHLDNKTFVGSGGQASDGKYDILSNPGFLQQSPGLADLTNGNQSGVIDQLIRHILDRPTASDTTYGIGITKLFKISSTAVTSGGSPSWPQTVTNMTSGESVIRLKANLYGFYNKASGGDILKMPLSTEVIDATWGSVTHLALESTPHPSAAKEDIMVFGNGRYVGVYIEGSSSLNVRKLDFGEGSEVADVIYTGGLWYLAVNYGEGRRGQVYLYDGSAISTILSDEAGIGSQKIGFLYVLNGIVYVAYQDNSSGAFAIGWLSGRQLKQLKNFSGALPTHREKTLYRNTILFNSSDAIYSMGAVTEQLPLQISKLADGGHATLGGLAAPFGTPMTASTDGGSNYRLAKFSGLSVDSSWRSIFVDISGGGNLGKIDKVIVSTKALGTGARADISIEGNQGAKTSSAFQITTANKTRHIFKTVNLPALEDMRVFVDSTNGSTSVACPIRKVEVMGHLTESI